MLEQLLVPMGTQGVSGPVVQHEVSHRPPSGAAQC